MVLTGWRKVCPACCQLAASPWVSRALDLGSWKEVCVDCSVPGSGLRDKSAVLRVFTFFSGNTKGQWNGFLIYSKPISNCTCNSLLMSIKKERNLTSVWTRVRGFGNSRRPLGYLLFFQTPRFCQRRSDSVSHDGEPCSGALSNNLIEHLQRASRSWKITVGRC